MSQPFKKKKQESSPQSLTDHLNFLLGSQLLQSQSTTPFVLQRSLILKSAMFWDSRNRIEKIKSLVLSNLNLPEFDDVQDFSIRELTSITQLSLSKNKIVHLHPISILDTLVTLNVSHNCIYNLSPLESLLNLQKFYASNNHISNIDPLKGLTKLRVVNVYRNKITNLQGTISVLRRLPALQEVDIEENPVYSETVRKQFVCLPIVRLNDELISKDEKERWESKTGIESSCVINPLSMSMVRDTKTSFYNISSQSIKNNKLKELREEFQNSENEYNRIDDEFEEEIVKNVHLKATFHQLNQRVILNQQRKEEHQYKADQIKLLKRKVKNLKQNLFTKDRKGELLRRMFELETQAGRKKGEGRQIKKEVVWNRRFDSDDVIVISGDDEYLEEDQELAELLANNSSALEELRKQLQSLS